MSRVPQHDKTFKKEANLATHTGSQIKCESFNGNQCGGESHCELALTTHAKIHKAEELDTSHSLVHVAEGLNVHLESLPTNNLIDENAGQHEKARDCLTKSESLPCGSCELVFHSVQALKAHTLTAHSSGKRYTCEQCKACFVSLALLKRHQISHSKVLHSCQKCSVQFNSSRSLALHYRIHNEHKPYACKLCGQRWTMSSHLSKHMMNVHVAREKPHQHAKFGRELSSASALKGHAQTHIADKPFQC